MCLHTHSIIQYVNLITRERGAVVRALKVERQGNLICHIINCAACVVFVPFLGNAARGSQFVSPLFGFLFFYGPQF